MQLRNNAKSRLLRAAENGDVGAQFNLGVLYDNRLDDNGYRIGANRAEAIKWLLRAAEQDLPRAQLKLAQLYADQIDAPETGIEACAWFLRAIARLSGMNREHAQRGFDRLAAQLAPEQVDEARRVAQGPTPVRRKAPGDAADIEGAGQ